MRRLLLGALLAVACDGVEGPLVRTDQDGTAGSGAEGGSATSAWSPSPGVSWQAQLSGELDDSLEVDLYYVDVANVTAETRAALRSAGRRFACYLSAGSLEPWRDDAGAFPQAALGNPLEGYPDERWLDVRDDRVRSLMAARVGALASAACDAVLPANLDGYRADSGFALTAGDELDYARWLAQRIHAEGMSAGLSLADELIAEALPDFDWSLAIDCLADSECPGHQLVRAAGKAVLLIEFGDQADADVVCPAAERLGFDALIKQPDLGAFRVGCSD